MTTIDYAIVILYVAFAIVVGLLFAKRAGKDVDQYFLSGRTLPWWLAGTSMVATSFAADTPLVVSGWVREKGIWQNWLWWGFAISGILGVYLFSRWWRRGRVMTKAELAELRYPGPESRPLRLTLGLIHSSITNTLVLCWVMLAAGKILGGVFGLPQQWGIGLACAIALSYSCLAGFWGVVVTDLVQFAIAMIGSISLAYFSWSAIGGITGLEEHIASSGDSWNRNTLAFVPQHGPGTLFDASFWTVEIANFCVFLGLWWWAAENVDGSGTSVQRISASRDERQGMLAVLWYNVAHYALRPWPWIIVGLASLVVFPDVAIKSPVAGIVTQVQSDAVTIAADSGDSIVVPFHTEATSPPDSKWTWLPESTVKAQSAVRAGTVVARTDPEKAYVAMMMRYLPVGMLGLVFASLLAAFMSTIDTHINLASSFFVNDVYRRFWASSRPPRHYVAVARITTVTVLLVGALLATAASRISDLFVFFLSLLAGVGPVYLARWLWWRVTAQTEIVAMLTSLLTSTVLTLGDFEWNIHPFSEGQALTAAGRQVIVVLTSGTLCFSWLLLTKAPDPRSLVTFYRRVRPVGFWGPVRKLAAVQTPPPRLTPLVVGVVGGLALIYGALFGTGHWLLGRAWQTPFVVSWGLAALGVALTVWALRNIEPLADEELHADAALSDGNPGTHDRHQTEPEGDE